MKQFARFAQWFAIGVFSALILTGGVISHWTRNHILSQSQLEATVTATMKSDILENSSDNLERPLRKWGYMDRKGRLVIPPRFDDAGTFSSGVARVEIDEGGEKKIGFINREGEFVFSICGKDCLIDDHRHMDFSEGLLPLRKEPNGKFGYVDPTGKFVIKPQFNFARSFADGLALVYWVDANDKDRTSYIDRTGKIVIDIKGLGLRDFQQGVAVVVKPFESTRYGLIDRQGNFLVKPILSAIQSWDNTGYSGSNPQIEFSWGRIPVQIVPEEEVQISDSIPPEWSGKWGYIDRKGNWVIEPKFDGAGQFTEGRAVIIHETENDPDWWQWGILIDEKGNIIDTSQQDPKPRLRKLGAEFHKGLMPAGSENGKSGYINRKGNWAIKPQFAVTENFYDGLAAVKTLDFKWGYINRSGEFVIAPQFDFAYDFQDNGLALVQIGEKDGIINRRGEYVLEPKHSIGSNFGAGIGTIFIDGITRIYLDGSERLPSYFLNSDLEILPCPHWHNPLQSSEGLIPIFTDVAPQKECPIARENE
ncbi:MAG: WG repeat-containing protein [Cyanobacteria bacterium SBLK]|nr:WG repeat-containing protein [Cyanobacteria bacterium SBLK]